MLMMLVGVVTADVQELAQNSLLYLTQEKKTKNIGYTQLWGDRIQDEDWLLIRVFHGF